MSAFLETSRLRLRPFTEADLDHLVDLDNDPDVMRYLNGGQPVTRDTVRTETLPRILHDHPGTGGRGFWAAEDKANGEFLGWFEFRPLVEHGSTEVELDTRPAG